MEVFFAFLVKLTIIFLGSGLVLLLALWVSYESSAIARSVLKLEFGNIQEDKLKVLKHEKVSAQSGVYEVLVPGKDIVKLFSSHKGMKIV
ncbi:MAG: hypothetical protein HY094_09150 [Candidatus Melainabacteria bacterium]|nr:hypothetical protein [Candidatus Melainabacteria bacterium]